MKLSEQELPPPEWEERQRARGAHMLQGLPWAQFQRALGRRVVWAEGDGWSWLGIVMHGRGVRYLYVPYGPTARSAATLEAALTSLRETGSELGLDFVRCEPVGVPKAAVVKTGLRAVKEVQPEHTAIVDLSVSEEELRRQLNSGHRNAINGSERRGLEITFGGDPSDVEIFLKLMHQTARRRGFHAHPDDYYRAMTKTLVPLGAATIGLVRHENEVVAAAIFFDYSPTRAYAHAGATPAARKLQAAAPLVWGAMLEAKARGLQRFDLWGVASADASADHPWAGFSTFKRAFGGEEVSYTGTWELPLKPVKYVAIRFAKRLVR